MSRNRWTDAEVELVINRAVEQRAEDRELTKVDSLYRAQDVIAEARRKKQLTPHFKRSLLARLEKAEQKARSLQGHIPTPVPQPESPPPPPTLNELLAEKLRDVGQTFATMIVDALVPA